MKRRLRLQNTVDGVKKIGRRVYRRHIVEGEFL
jgi:hypothetical protein